MVYRIIIFLNTIQFFSPIYSKITAFNYMNSSKSILVSNHSPGRQMCSANVKNKQQPLAPKHDNQNQPHTFFAFLQRQKDSHIPLRTSSPIAERKNKMKDKQNKEFKTNHIDALRSAILPTDKVHSKWIVENFDYLNKIGIYAPPPAKAKSCSSAQPSMPKYRHFGDTKPSRITMTDVQADQQQIIYRYLQAKREKDSSYINESSAPIYTLSNAMKDIVFACAVDGDVNVQRNTPNNPINHKRLNSTTADASQAQSLSSPQYRNRQRAMKPTVGQKLNDRLSNISSSNSHSSDASTPDSIEQEIIHSKNRNNTDSYLGPFNFRQLLRPTQGPTDSLRKRKGNVALTPPPLQKGKA